ADDSVRHALRALVRRHEALRVRFAADGANVRRIIAADGEAELRVVEADLSQLGDALGHQLRAGFDLERGPLLRALLCRPPGEAPVLLLVTHRITSDVLPPALLRSELAEFCAARHEGRAPMLSAPDQLPRPQPEQSWAIQDIEYWRERLAALAPVSLPLDRPR